LAAESALRAGISDAFQHLFDRRCGLIRRQARKRLVPGDPQRLCPGMRVGPVLGLAMLVTFVDRAGLLENPDRPPVDLLEVRSSLFLRFLSLRWD
jgi:hypothetical protein